jgi:cytochrome d ubiquinol oxidase subunit I
MLKKRDLPFARRSFAIAAIFGLASTFSVILLGDESGYELGDVQKTKLAAIEAEWETQPAPASFTLFGIPNQQTMQTDYEVKIPYALGIIATRSLDKQVIGIKDLMVQHEARIRNGMLAYDQLEKLRAGDKSPELLAAFKESQKDLGYGLLLKKYTPNVVDATEAHIKSAVKDTIPTVPALFWSFRIMVASGFLMLLLFLLASYATIKRNAEKKPLLLKFALLSLPLPWVAAQTGWFVAEHGRQPWSIGEILPTHLSASSLSTGDLYGSIFVLVVFYTVLLIIEMYLMIKFARLGPSSLHTGRYHFEQLEAQANGSQAAGESKA